MLYTSLFAPLKDWRKFEIRIECTEQQCVMLAMVHLRVSVMTQRWTVSAIHTCIVPKSPLAGHCVMTSSVYPLTFWFHSPIHKTYVVSTAHTSHPMLSSISSSLQVLLVQECVLLIEVCALQDHVLKAEVLLLTRSDCFRLRPGIRTRANPSQRQAACWAISYYYSH